MTSGEAGAPADEGMTLCLFEGPPWCPSGNDGEFGLLLFMRISLLVEEGDTTSTKWDRTESLGKEGSERTEYERNKANR